MPTMVHTRNTVTEKNTRTRVDFLWGGVEMYSKKEKGWLKHWDFIIIDMLSLQLAFLFAYFIRHGFVNPYSEELYVNSMIFINIANISVIFMFSSFKNVLKRGYYREFLETTKQVVILQLLVLLYLFTIKSSYEYSRFVLYTMAILHLLISYVLRLIRKRSLRRKTVINRTSLLVITTEANVEELLKNLQKNNYKNFIINGLVILDSSHIGRAYNGIRVVADKNTVIPYVRENWVDEVFIMLKEPTENSHKIIKELSIIGVTVHEVILKNAIEADKKVLVEDICGYTVLTTAINYVRERDAFIKRLIDIAFGIVGVLLTGVITIFVAPLIYLKSPGPIFFTQSRVGKNGKLFKIYKFRSMYLDAEERKKELLDKNRIKDGLMFKLDFDPRIIGNEIGKDGKKRTGIGNFIRATSIDEFPQFLNVLKGEMSVVGTRPPTIEEYQKYELHHKSRLAIKPGITGLWQVSGRSKITDFEEVVRLDREYIDNYSLGLDIKIIIKTIAVVLKRDGSY